MKNPSKEQQIQNRLGCLRSEIENETISYSGIAELEELADYIPESDVVLREWAGLPEWHKL